MTLAYLVSQFDYFLGEWGRKVVIRFVDVAKLCGTDAELGRIIFYFGWHSWDPIFFKLRKWVRTYKMKMHSPLFEFCVHSWTNYCGYRDIRCYLGWADDWQKKVEISVIVWVPIKPHLYHGYIVREGGHRYWVDGHLDHCIPSNLLSFSLPYLRGLLSIHLAA